MSGSNEAKAMHASVKRCASTIVHDVIQGDTESDARADVYVGMCGRALALAKAADAANSNGWFRDALGSTSSALLQQAEALIQHMHTRRKPTMWSGEAGIVAVSIYIKMLRGQHDSAVHLLHQLEQQANSALCLERGNCEPMGGKAGFMIAAMLAIESIEQPATVDLQLQALADSIVSDGQQLARQFGKEETCGLMYQWHGKEYLGAVHGIAGILTVLLEAERRSLITVTSKADVSKAINWLCSLQFDDGNFPSSLPSAYRNKLVQFCHGCPGVCFLLKIAMSQGYGSQKIVSHALARVSEGLDLRSAEVAERKESVGLCHGLAGNAYATFASGAASGFRLTTKACDLYSQLRCCPDRPSSLFEGSAGLLSLLADLYSCEDKQSMGFPAFTRIKTCQQCAEQCQ